MLPNLAAGQPTTDKYLNLAFNRAYMKKMFFIPIILTFIGCNRYVGWQYVRIERQLPSNNCEYKIQEACYQPGAGCFNYYKKRATLFKANTVVLTSLDQGESSSSRVFVNNMGGGGGSKSNMAFTALADYYYCTDTKTPKGIAKKDEQEL